MRTTKNIGYDCKFCGISTVFLVLPCKEIALVRDPTVWDLLWVSP